MQHFWQAFLLAKNQWGRRILAGIGMLVDSAGLIIIPLLIRQVFDSLTEGQSANIVLEVINSSVLWLVIIGLLRSIFVYIEIYYQEGTGAHISHDIRKLLFDKILFLPFSFFDKNKTGDLMSVLTRDVDAVRDGTGFVIMLVIVNIMIIIGITTTMFLLHPILTLIVLASLPLLGLLAFWYSKRIGPLYQSLQEQSGRLHTVSQENIAGIRVVKAFTRKEEEQKRFGAENRLFYQTRLKIAYLSSLVHPSLDFLGTVVGFVAIAAGGYYAIKGEITLGTMIAFTSFADFLIWPIRQIGWLSEMFQRSIAGVKRIYQIINEENTLINQDNPIAKPIKGSISFKNVTFAYNDDEPAIKNFSLDIPAGSTICLLGLTGSGKTTVANLLARFYDPDQGEITIDDMDIRNWELDSLRSQIGFVFQDNFLFSTSLIDNITMGTPTNTDDVLQAAKWAQAYDFIHRLPENLDSLVGERGIGLSGGERQRVAIARAILKKPPILIFDDSSASLDMKTEAALQRDLRGIYQGRTVIIIAQRVSTAQNADCIIVLDSGRIVEKGTHYELLSLGGIYSQLNEIQSKNLSLNVGD